MYKNKEIYEQLINQNCSITDIAKRLKIGNTTVRSWLKKFNLKTKYDKSVKKYNIEYKICPICQKQFLTKIGHKREKVVCSRSCSNSFFRSGNKNPNYTDGTASYRAICLKNHKHACIICGFDKFVEVHHIDKNHNNISPSNLIPLCPNHHRLIHSKKYKDETIIEINNKLGGIV